MQVSLENKDFMVSYKYKCLVVLLTTGFEDNNIKQADMECPSLTQVLWNSYGFTGEGLYQVRSRIIAKEFYGYITQTRYFQKWETQIKLKKLINILFEVVWGLLDGKELLAWKKIHSITWDLILVKCLMCQNFYLEK